jgi:DNA polymerase-3 subunit epsilon
MLEKAPAFRQIAHKVYDMLEGCVFVAHNVNFDYSFVRAELMRENYTLDLRKLCTVRMSRKIFPGYRSYSLGNLCGALGIDIEHRHRAMGDAYATFEVLKLLLHNDDTGHIYKALNIRSKEQALPPNVSREVYEQLPNETGVYYFHDAQGKIIYVGKALNIKKRVAQHFSGNSKGPQRQAFMRDIHSISYELTGNELVALLLESNEIHTHWPRYNRAQKKPELAYGIFASPGGDGYTRLAVDRLRKHSNPAARFDSFAEAFETLRHLVPQYQLCMAKCVLQTTGVEKLICDDGCLCHLGATRYNQAVQEALDSLTADQTDLLIIARGRHDTEQAIVLFKQGLFMGYGFVEQDAFDMSQPEAFIKPMKHYGFASSAAGSFISRFGREYKAVYL